MKLIVKQTKSLNGIINVPGSKSQSIRALIIALLSKGETQIENILIADDTSHAKTLCQKLGAEISSNNKTPNILNVKSEGVPLKPQSTHLNSGNSGITTCFVLPLLGLREDVSQPMILDCEEQMRKRPIRPLIEALQRLGLKIESIKNDNTLPLRVSHRLIGGETQVDGSNSQYLSTLLLSLPYALKDSKIRVHHLQERPYVNLTLDYLQKHNIKCSHQSKGDLDIYQIKGQQNYSATKTFVSGDYSSASYAIAVGTMIPGKIVIHGLNANDKQGDKRLVDLLKAMGGSISVEENQLTLQGGRSLNGIKINASDIPDLLPTLAVIGTYARGQTEIRGVRHARIKETDRIQSMCEGLKAMGAKLEEKNDGITVWNSKLKGTLVHGYNDHRTVMALSIAGLLASGTTTITTPEAIKKTYPTYIDSMKAIHAKMSLSEF